MAWDTTEPYHYTRLHPAADGARDLIIIGGEDHKTGEADDMLVRLARLEAWGRMRFPAIDAFSFHWSGQVMVTADDAALIGRNPGDADNILIATGDCGTGLTHGTIAGLIISEKIQGRMSPWASPYDPARPKPTKGATQPSPHPPQKVVALEQSVTRGSGAVISRGPGKIAFYRRPGGKRVLCSAKCTHAGCAVAWNQFEQCWDCPCHGSQFAANGTVINAPAVKNLTRVIGQERYSKK